MQSYVYKIEWTVTVRPKYIKNVKFMTKKYLYYIENEKYNCKYAQNNAADKIFEGFGRFVFAFYFFSIFLIRMMNHLRCSRLK